MDRTALAETTGLRQTSSRLAAALLGYFAMVTFVITMAPFEFVRRPLELSWYMMPSDMVANVALFVPIGFLTRSLGNPVSRNASAFLRCGRPAWHDVLLAALFSGLIETSQIFVLGRIVSPIDVGTNTCGALLGVILRERIERSAVWHPQVVGRIGLDIPLVGLLYLLVPQLWLSGVGLVDDARRSATIVLLAAAGSIVLVALHRHRWHAGVRLAAHSVPVLGLLWFTIGALPAVAGAPQILGPLALAVVLIAAWLLRPAAAVERRFEADTLGRFIPVFMLYLVVAALWPPLRALAPWHGAIALPEHLTAAAKGDMFMLLEQIGGFTLLGYAAAESRGRRELTLREDLPAVTCWALAFAAGLEVMQGVLVGPGASLARALLATSAAVYGTAVYHLARTHVRVLRAGQPSWPAADQQRAA